MVAGLTLLNSFTWEHSLDNASASLEGNTPSPQDGNNLRADYAQSDYNLPIENVTSLVYDLPVGHGRHFLSDSNAVVNAVLGGWQVSAISTAQAGTPFNLTYSPNSAQAVSPQISATYRGANEYRPNVVPGQKLTQRVKQAAHRLHPVRQLRGAVAAGDQERCGRAAEPVRQRIAQPGPYAGVLRDGSRPEQALQHADGGREGGVPDRGVQRLQPHQPVPSFERSYGHAGQLRRPAVASSRAPSSRAFCSSA